VAQLPFRLPDAPARTDLVAKYFRALGDPTRLRVLQLLQAEGELSAGALTRRLTQPQPKVSNHLACLRWCGFVDTRRDHRVIYYRLADDRVAAMLELADGLLASNAEHVAACCRIPEAEVPANSVARQLPTRPRPLIEVLAYPGCPNRDDAIALAARVCEQLGSAAEVRVIDIPDQPAAEQACFLGSPTIRVDGRDIEPGAERQQEYVHACRLYQVGHSLRGLPDEDWLRQALLAAETRR
jgi:DNA-binding transcriptional ArsR family regulator